MNENERIIGRVVAVESERVLVELDKDSRSLTKTFVTGIYPIARINSYVIFPVGSVSIVGIVTRISMAKENIELTSDATISLPQPKRTITVTMVGTLERKNNKTEFSYGIVQYPALDNPVWFILESELDCIFDNFENKKYFLEIGKSTIYPDYSVKIFPDKLFSRHLGILGNTGAGKSCTIATILQSILNHEEVIKGKNSHFIIFDTNGEYKKAFENSEKYNLLHIDQAGLNIPYWFMNFHDFRTLFQAREGSQIPILSKALTYARNPNTKPSNAPQNVANIIDDAKTYYSNLRNKYPTKSEEEHYNYVLQQKNINDTIKSYIKSELLACNEKKVDILKDVDSPSFFEKNYFRKTSLEYSFQESGSNANQIRGYCETMLQRIDRFFNDPRYEFLFHNFSEKDLLNPLANFLRLCFGRLNTVDFENNKSKNDDFYFINKYVANNSDTNKNYQVIVFDLSLMPYDILQSVTALLGRLILEFLQRIEKIEDYNGNDVRGKFPVVLVLEEAHNYIPQYLPDDKESVSRDVFERISKEGRKYGLSLVVSSQRPSELSKTVLSQCNSYIVHRVQNPEDQEYIKKLLPTVSHDLLKQLPILAQGIALVFGDCVRAPMQVKINEPKPKPKSSDPEYWKHWTNSYNAEDNYPFKNGEPDFEKVCNLWEGKKS